MESFKTISILQKTTSKEQGLIRKHHEKFQSPPQVCPDGAGKPIGFNGSLTAFLAFASMYQINNIINQ